METWENVTDKAYPIPPVEQPVTSTTVMITEKELEVLQGIHHFGPGLT